jgi:hypothetical protein
MSVRTVRKRAQDKVKQDNEKIDVSDETSSMDVYV